MLSANVLQIRNEDTLLQASGDADAKVGSMIELAQEDGGLVGTAN